MLPLLLAALGAPGAAPFVLQVASLCSLAPNGSAGVTLALARSPLVLVRAAGGLVVLPGPERLCGCDAGAGAVAAAPFVLQVASWCSLAPNGSAGVTLALARSPLVCAELGGGRTGPCPGAGAALAELGAGLAQALRGDPRWQQRLRDRERVCRELPRIVGTLPKAPPQLRIVPERSGAALTLACHAWGFSPPAITLRWLRNGAAIEEPRGPPRALPLGDGTFRAQVNIEVTPATAGDTLECWALHPSLEEAISVTWAPGLSPKLSLLVALAVLALLLGLFLFIFGLRRYLSTGYTPLPGDTQAGNI